MRFLIFAIIALMSSVAQASEPTVTREFTLNKPFEVVIPLAQANARLLAKSIGGEVLSQSIDSLSINLDFINKDHNITIFRQKKIKVKIPNEEPIVLLYKERSVLKAHKIIITTVLAEENGILQYSKSVVEFTRADDKTEVSMQMWIKIKGAKSFWVRVISRVKLKKFETTMRDIVGDPLPEETD